jgi:hypothetical protein
MRNKAFAMTLTAPRLMAATRRLMNQRSAQAMMNAATGMEGLLVSLPFSAGLPGRPNGWRAAIPRHKVHEDHQDASRPFCALR